MFSFTTETILVRSRELGFVKHVLELVTYFLKDFVNFGIMFKYGKSFSFFGDIKEYLKPIYEFEKFPA